MRKALYVCGVGGLLASLSMSNTACADTGGELEEVLVTAQKRTERVQDVPIAIVTQTGEQLARAGVADIRDLATVTPGLTFSTTGAWSQPAIRGISSTTTNVGSESPVAIYLDGVYMPSQTSQIFDLPDVEHIEVLKGPQGTLFGRNSTAGAIQIFTRDPSFTTTGQLVGTVGMLGGGDAKTAGHYSVRGFGSTPIIADKLAVSISGYYDRNDGYLRDIARGDRSYGDVESKAVRAKVLFQPTDAIKFVLSGFYMERNDDATEAASISTGKTLAAGVPGAIIPTKPWTVAYDSPAPNYHSETYGFALRGDFDIGSLGKLTSVTGYMHIAAQEHVDVDGTFVSENPVTRLTACPACTAYDVDNPDKSFSQELNFASNSFGIFSLTAGASYFKADSLQAGNANNNGFFYTHQAKTKSYGIYSELTANPIDPLFLIAGVRYTHNETDAFGSIFGTSVGKYQTASYNSTTPRFSARYALNERSNLFLTYSKGFKTGVTQLPYCVPTATFDCSPAKPETVTAWEGGYKSGGPTHTLSVSVFHYTYKDLQLLVFDGVGANTQNATSAKITGVDADALFSVGSGLSVRGAVSWIPKAEFDEFPNAAVFFSPTPTIDATGSRLLRTPKITASAGLDYVRPLQNGANLDANLTLYYSSSYNWEVTEQLVTDAYTTLGARVGYKLANSPVKFSLYGKNLTNEHHIQGTLISGAAFLEFYAPPREVGLQAELNF